MSYPLLNAIVKYYLWYNNIMNKGQKTLARLYRITPEQDRLVKHNASIFGGESAYIRKLIDEGVVMTVKWVPVLHNPKKWATII